MKNLLRLLVVPLVAVTGLIALSPSGVASAHGSGQNGCTLSPDYVFHDACDRHDVCYDASYIPATAAGRKSCDDQFLRDMWNICSSRYSGWRATVARNYCYSVANTYYNAVRWFGYPYFKNPWLN